MSLGLRTFIAGAALILPAAAIAQQIDPPERGSPRVTPVGAAATPVGTIDSWTVALDGVASHAPVSMTDAPRMTFLSAADSMEWVRERSRAEHAGGYRVVIELFERHLKVIDGNDTLLVAPVAVGMRDSIIAHEDRFWRFDTPRGRRVVRSREANPVWIPPDWHYVEVAAQLGLELVPLDARTPVELADGRFLEFRDGRAGVRDRYGFVHLPADEQLIFDGKLFVPPFGTENRRIPGELGRFRLDLGDGYLLHGTPHTDSIGSATTHGCIRLFDEDIEWMYLNVPVGTPVYIY